ncbi:hypothetical protein [Archangium lipolyticum]|uniref:hypothetical protein n=1 Tax=Archangium lipolyticum TaxID=2970465 RepID=UPI002149AF40|nr:hypothetical protein [Archangium lipolyticum]
MRSHLPLSRLSPLLGLLVLSGCNTAYREAMSRAEDAAVRGDFLTAAIAYRSACAASPDDEKACSRAPIFARKATDNAIATARPACDAGDLDQCLPPLLATQDIMPGDPEVSSMLEKASKLHAERCASQWKAEGPLSTALAEVACLQSRARQLPVPSYEALLTQRATQLSSRFASLAATAQGPANAGAASVLWNAAKCLAPDTNTTSRFEQARQGFLTQSAIPVSARIGGKMSPQISEQLSNLCERISGNLAPAARCAESGVMPGQPEPLEIYVNAFIQRAVENVSEDVRRLNYVSGTRQVPNPEFREARKNLRRAEQDYDHVVQQKKNKDAECAESKRTHDASCVGCTEQQKKSPCDEAKELADVVDRRARERNDVRNHLNNLPETLTENVYEDFTYSVLTHRWASAYRFTVQASTPGSAPSASQEGELRFEDMEHVGFGPAGLQPDPLEIPTSGSYANAFLQQVTPHVFAAVQQDSVARGAARRAQCSALPANWGLPWVQCWAEASLWQNGQEPQVNEFLNLLATSAGTSDQPQCR